jgi:predicted transcriptional regulator
MKKIIKGKKVLTINTEKPWDIESTEGLYKFKVLPNQICMLSDNLDFEIMQMLFHELWLQSDNGELPIDNIAFSTFEVSKMAWQKIAIIKEYINFLTDNNFLEICSTNPLQYQFTEKGRKIKTPEDIKKIIENRFD